MSEAVRYLMAWSQYYGLSGQIVSGYRSFRQQVELYAKGRTTSEIINRVAKHGVGGSVTDAYAGESAHNYGLAVDIEGPHQAEILQLAVAMGFQTVTWDPAHIEWPNWQRLLR